MSNDRRILGIVALTLGFTAPALLADIHVQHIVSGSTWSADDQTLASGPTVNVTISDTTSGIYRIFVDSPTSESIGTITINSQSTGAPTLFVGQGFVEPDDTDRLMVAGCYNLAGVTWSGGKPRLQARIYHDVTGDINMWHVVRIDVGNELKADVYHDGGGVTPAPRLGVVKAYRFVAPSFGPQEIVAAHGDIHRVEAEFESYTDVIATEGSIDEIQASTITPGGWFGDVLALNGSIGSIINEDYSIITNCIQAKNGIGTIRGKYFIDADIRANANGGSGNLTTLQMPYGGDFSGSVQANTITGERDGEGNFTVLPVTIYGDFDGDAIIETSLDGPWICRGITTGHTIKIRRNLGEDAYFAFSVFGSGFIDGQVIINADNDGYEWLGNVGVGELGFTNIPYYSNTGFGAGAVGLAPYHIHNEGCDPPNHGYIDMSAFNSTNATGAVIRYYGPVNIPSPSGVIDIDMEVPYQTGSWYTDIDSYFSVTVHPSGVPGSPRAVRIRRANVNRPVPPGHYRVTIDDEGTQCVGVAGLPSAVSNVYDFWIAVDCNDDSVLDASDFLSGTSCDAMTDCNCNGVDDQCDIDLLGYVDADNSHHPDICDMTCPCDWNSSGTINSQDFFDFIACFFGSCPPGRTGDYNNDSYVNSQDFFDFLYCFFNGC